MKKEWKEQAGENRHQSLKEIEFVGWIGLEKTDAQFAHYLMDSAISLEKLILDFTSPCFDRRKMAFLGDTLYSEE